MKLEEEKKLVAKWLGGEYVVAQSLFTDAYYEAKDGKLTWGWNPEGCRGPWDEIWEKLEDEGIEMDYHTNIASLCPEMNKPDFAVHIVSWFLHTAKPETCWKALLETLENENNQK